MRLKKHTTGFFFALIFACCVFFISSNLTANSNQATVPINITVAGKLIITDAESDNIPNSAPNLDRMLRFQKSSNKSSVYLNKAIRIRTNLNTWKLTAQRTDLQNQVVTINPKNISVLFTTQAGSKANRNAGKLISPFNTKTNLSKISSISPVEILIGNSKTSSGRDPKDRNNWFQLTSTYTISPSFLSKNSQWSTLISYNLVSP